MSGEMPRVSVVVPAYNEGDQILPVLDRLFESVHLQCEVLVVVDDEADTTVPVVTEYALKEPRARAGERDQVRHRRRRRPGHGGDDGRWL
jgi:dolichol-phosphate mannosyltransferase